VPPSGSARPVDFKLDKPAAGEVVPQKETSESLMGNISTRAPAALVFEQNLCRGRQ